MLHDPKPAPRHPSYLVATPHPPINSGSAAPEAIVDITPKQIQLALPTPLHAQLLPVPIKGQLRLHLQARKGILGTVRCGTLIPYHHQRLLKAPVHTRAAQGSPYERGSLCANTHLWAYITHTLWEPVRSRSLPPALVPAREHEAYLGCAPVYVSRQFATATYAAFSRGLRR